MRRHKDLGTQRSICDAFKQRREQGLGIDSLHLGACISTCLLHQGSFTYSCRGTPPRPV